MNAPDELTSLLELCFGDAEDDEDGRRDLLVQFDAWPGRAHAFRAQLDALLGEADAQACRRLLSDWVHLDLPPREAVRWLRDLRTFVSGHTVFTLEGPLARFSGRLSLPLIAAPMFLVSGPALVGAACRNGVIGSFPTANCRTVEQLGQWFDEIRANLDAFEQASGRRAAPLAPNLIVHRSNPRVADDLRAVIAAKAEIVIASVGSPKDVVAPLHDAGCLVLADVASMRHAEKAIEAGADGLILLTAGAGGQTGWANPFAFARAVRAIWDGPVVMAGGISDGHALHAARVLGCDLAYMGTPFIATEESMAPRAWKEMLVASRLDDVLLTRAFTGLETNMLRPSIVAAGLDPDALPVRGGIDITKDINPAERERPGARRWKDVWSAGHSVSGVTAIRSVEAFVAQVRADYLVSLSDARLAVSRSSRPSP